MGVLCFLINWGYLGNFVIGRDLDAYWLSPPLEQWPLEGKQ